MTGIGIGFGIIAKLTGIGFGIKKSTGIGFGIVEGGFTPGLDDATLFHPKDNATLNLTMHGKENWSVTSSGVLVKCNI